MSFTTLGYLNTKYLHYPYLSSLGQRGTPSQVNLVIAANQKILHAQATLDVINSRAVRSQVNLSIVGQRALHMQVSSIILQALHSQVTLSIYNTSHLRVLMRFPSRGTNGLTWTASSTAAGDFSANNLNSDIVEYYWRSADTVTSAVTLDNDSQVSQGFFCDTIAFLGHNLTLSAIVRLQESNTADFSVIGNELLIPMQLENSFYVAPTLPTAGYRYRRFTIDDTTNSNSYLKIGTIVMGAAIILSGDDIIDTIKWRKRHFKDVIQTEGFTNVSNDRALRRVLQLSFRDMDFSKNNYANLQTLFDYARTSLKCLWIPTPDYPTRFGIFGKLTELPDETHNDKGVDLNLIDLDIEIDESL